MRQVPTKFDYLIIGNGRIAKHLNFYLSQHQAKIFNWNRKENSLKHLSELSQSAQTILFCIPDREINSLCIELQFEQNKMVHFSGTLETELALGFHPLMTFGHELFPFNHYVEIPFVGTQTINEFQKTFPNLKNKYFQISKDQKSYYHSLCVLSGNGTTLLWELIRNEFKKMQLPKEILNPFLMQVSKNIIFEDEGRFTGPWYRKDEQTIEEHKKNLTSSPLKNIYDEFLNLSVLGSSI